MLYIDNKSYRLREYIQQKNIFILHDKNYSQLGL